ncbi:hypothetical protein ACHAWF_012021 [Thalassiosira exigua]
MRKLPNGMRIRGDMNVCLMGDPGVAKSQLLKHVASIVPRGVYDTLPGMGSSGVGLTAAITKDATTMDEANRTAIHKVMEQQPVSVAKAGIVAKLKARAAVLVATNLLYRRYNSRKSLSENVNLPNSLLSQFGLMVLILYVTDVDWGMALARHYDIRSQERGGGHKEDEDNDSYGSVDDDLDAGCRRDDEEDVEKDVKKDDEDKRPEDGADHGTGTRQS